MYIQSTKTELLKSTSVWSFLPSLVGRHDIAEILLKVVLKHQKSKKSINLGEVIMF
jgi:hypothetical protein